MTLQAHLLGVQGEVDELLVLVAVADEVGLGVVHVGEGGDQLRLASRPRGRSGSCSPNCGDLLDDLPLLVDLDRIDAAVLAAVAGVLDGLAERFVEFRDARWSRSRKRRSTGSGAAVAQDPSSDVMQGGTSTGPASPASRTVALPSALTSKNRLPQLSMP